MSGHDDDMISPRLLDAASAGCEESRLLVNRRALMGMSAGLFAWASLPKAANAATPVNRRLLVVVLRGGLDGLHVAYKSGEKDLLKAYRLNMLEKGDYLGTEYTLLARDPTVLNPDTFTLHKKMANFRAMYMNGEAALVHAIAPPLRTRSHFDCQANMESGQPSLRNINNEGWLNRFLQGLVATQPMTRTLAVNNVPLIIKGAAEVQSWTYTMMQDHGDVFQSKCLSDYATKPKWQADLRNGLALNNKIESRSFDQSAVTMPFSVAGMLMGEQTGPRIAALSVDGLDTHASQISTLDSKLGEIDACLGAFKSAMLKATDGADVWKETVVVCVTEFGRSLRDNPSGTDHGVGTVAFLAGGNVNGGQVITDWPGIAAANLYKGADLTPTRDTRSLFRGLLQEHLGCRNEAFLNTTVFPGTTAAHAMSGLVRVPAEGLQIKPKSDWARA